MNKYSSKAVKTAATVGMSLAMVLSNVAPGVGDYYRRYYMHVYYCGCNKRYCKCYY